MLLRWSAAVVVWFSLLLPFGAPYLASASASILPPCCRADGKHHCAMMALLEVADQRADNRFRGALKACPYRTLNLAPGQTPLTPVPATPRSQFGQSQEPALPAAPAPLGQSAYLQSYPKRGPPLLG